MAKLTNKEIIASLKEMTLLEINDLIKEVESEFGVSASAPVAAAAAPVAAAAPTEASVVLLEAGANKVAIIKLFREATGLGLMEAKTAVEKGNSVIKENLPIAEAEAVKKQFEDQGAKVKLDF
ncbi:MAG: 50S ribosomal protein L7/L12 [Mycoplasmataceae bacterium]|jgi:large subunit ribosomal protein L7/L12|nr:50S ribosomal protein L7/L12 [Mycoplasmataceae bacterium]